jgi:hypothetical protein
MERDLTPIFILSLPRSGSTLLQRMLSVHSKMGTCSEPWFLLPVLNMFKADGLYANYAHRGLYKAVEDVSNNMPLRQDDFLKCIEKFSCEVYRKLLPGGEIYFIDKTPRYHLIVDLLFKTFPNAKFIFLWRNPLSIVSSINETWSGGQWKIHNFKVDLYQGLENLVAAKGSAQLNSISVRYEDLVADPQAQLSIITDFIGVNFEEGMCALSSAVDLQGRMGDPTGGLKYNEPSKKSIGSWKRGFSTPLRKMWARQYLTWIGKERLSVMGYDLEKIEADLHDQDISFRWLLSDVKQFAWGWVYCWLEPAIFFDKFKKMKSERYKVTAHR